VEIKEIDQINSLISCTVHWLGLFQLCSQPFWAFCTLL